jgi:hypothetical protein
MCLGGALSGVDGGSRGVLTRCCLGVAVTVRHLWGLVFGGGLRGGGLRHRAVGTSQKNLEGSNKTAATTVTHFFARFPELYPFLVAQLQDAVAATLRPEGAAAAPSGGPGQGVHPSLFPVLLLLSRLSSSLSVAEVATLGSAPVTGTSGGDAVPPAASNVEVFLPLLMDVARVGHHKGRVMAARALASVVPAGAIAACVRRLLEQLPRDRAMGVPFSQPVLGREPDEFAILPSVRMNTLDGLLLQVRPAPARAPWCPRRVHTPAGDWGSPPVRLKGWVWGQHRVVAVLAAAPGPHHHLRHTPHTHLSHGCTLHARAPPPPLSPSMCR